jgi:hypothetical protein
MSASMPRVKRGLLTLLALALLAVALVACGPEANRIEGDGKKSGGDVGNWGDPVQLHGDHERDARIYYRTPDEQPAER